MKNTRTFGFTIVELLISIGVIGILVALSVVTYNGIQNNARKVTVISDLDNALSVLEYDFVKTGTYPATVEDADGGDGLKASEGTTYQYTVDNNATPPTFCLTATNVNVSYYINSSVTKSSEGACPGHFGANLTNLVTNGSGELGNNTNFPALTYDPGNSAPDFQGSFVSPNGNYAFYSSSELIPVNPSRGYVLRGWARQLTPGITTSRWYFGLVPYDIDNNLIATTNYMYRPGTTTTLAQPLNTGDTAVYLDNLTIDWYDEAGSSTHLRSFIFWGYTDSTGKLWPPETYTRNPWYSNIYDGGVGAVVIKANVIVLNKPWPGPSYPAGHPVSNGGAGGTYMYSAASNQIVPESWQEWISPTITGITPSGMVASTITFPLATKSVKISIGFNAGSPPTTSRQAVSGIRFYETE